MTEEEKRKGAWGGQRERAGRKPRGPSNMVKKSVTLPADMVEELEHLGGGNLSEGIREAARRLHENASETD